MTQIGIVPKIINICLVVQPINRNIQTSTCINTSPHHITLYIPAHNRRLYITCCFCTSFARFASFSRADPRAVCKFLARGFARKRARGSARGLQVSRTRFACFSRTDPRAVCTFLARGFARGLQVSRARFRARFRARIRARFACFSRADPRAVCMFLVRGFARFRARIRCLSRGFSRQMQFRARISFFTKFRADPRAVSRVDPRARRE